MSNQSTTFTYVIYKITFPNNKIYIGKDIGKGGHDFNYFGSWNDEYVKKKRLHSSRITTFSNY